MFCQLLVLQNHREHKGLIVDQRLSSVANVILGHSLVPVLLISIQVWLDFNAQSLAPP